MTFKDVAQQYFDPLTQVQRLMLRHRFKILCRGTYTMFPGSGDDRSDRNLTLVIDPSFYAEKELQHPLLTSQGLRP